MSGIPYEINLAPIGQQPSMFKIYVTMEVLDKVKAWREGRYHCTSAQEQMFYKLAEQHIALRHQQHELNTARQRIAELERFQMDQECRDHGVDNVF